MIIKDKIARKLLNKVFNSRIEDYIKDLPEEECQGMSDLEILHDELTYYLELLEDETTVPGMELSEAKKILKHTKSGIIVPLSFPDLKPIYDKHEIEEAFEIVNEYKRIKSVLKSKYFNTEID